MTNKEFIWWLKGYIEGKSCLNPQETEKIKDNLFGIEEVEIKNYYRTITPTIDLTDLETPKGPKIICEDDQQDSPF